MSNTAEAEIADMTAALVRQVPDQSNPDLFHSIGIGKMRNIEGQDWVQYCISWPGHKVLSASVSPAEARAAAQWVLDNVPE